MHDAIRFEDAQEGDSPEGSTDNEGDAGIQFAEESDQEKWPEEWIPATGDADG